MMRTLPTQMLHLLSSFTLLFSERMWQYAQALLAGAILAPGEQTVRSALRVMGLDHEKRYQRYHRVLSCTAYSGLQ